VNELFRLPSVLFLQNSSFQIIPWLVFDETWYRQKTFNKNETNFPILKQLKTNFFNTQTTQNQLFQYSNNSKPTFSILKQLKINFFNTQTTQNPLFQYSNNSKPTFSILKQLKTNFFNTLTTQTQPTFYFPNHMRRPQGNACTYVHIFLFFFSVRLLSVLRGHSVFHPHHNGQ